MNVNLYGRIIYCARILYTIIGCMLLNIVVTFFIQTPLVFSRFFVMGQMDNGLMCTVRDT